MVSSQARRDQVALAMERGHSQRQACKLIELPRSILKYRSRRAERDVSALDAMRRIAATYPPYGYRRVRIFLHREGHVMSPDRAYRLWRTAGLQLPRRSTPCTRSPVIEVSTSIARHLRVQSSAMVRQRRRPTPRRSTTTTS